MKARRDEAAYHLQALRRIEEKERGESAPGEVPGALGILADLIRTTPEDAPLFDVFWREEARARVVPAEEFLKGMPDGLKGSYLLVPAAERPAVPGDVLSRPEVLGLLKGRLEPHERMKDSLARLEDAVIVRSVGEAVRLWVGHPGLNFLTPAGDLLLASGLLKLGEKSGGIIALAAEARRFEDEAGRLEDALVPLAAGLEARAAEAAALEAELETERERLLGADRTLADRRKEHGFSRAEGEKVRANRDLLVRELEVLRSDKESLARTLDALRGRLDAGDSRLLSLRGTIEEKERALAGRQETVDASARSHFELRAGLDLLQEKMNGLRSQLEAAARRKEAAEAKINALESDARKSEEDKARLREDIAAFREKAKALRAEQAGAEAAQAAAESGMEAVRGDVERLEAALRRTREEEAAAKDERVRHEIRKAEVDRDLVNLDEMCWQELKKTLAELRAESEAASQASPGAPAPEAEAEAEDLGEGAEDEAEEAPAEAATSPEGTEAAAAGGPPEAPRPRRAAKRWRPLAEMSDEEVERELDESRESLNRYKAVNLMAEEEFLEQKTRHDFLVGQRQDLRDSIHSTEEAILKIDEESKAQFLKALEEVAKNFQELFTALFKGGNAEVKLLEPDNPLESGVEIVAQPPGKRVQNLNLLSGGEKSLTSMAFLFALFRYKPSPFCFLDEVDAALDDVNLMRFLDLLKAIKHQTQFVLITHNYKTMEVADYIYGTTMSEPNMTKLLSVKLERKGGGEVLNNPS